MEIVQQVIVFDMDLQVPTILQDIRVPVPGCKNPYGREPPTIDQKLSIILSMGTPPNLQPLNPKKGIPKLYKHPHMDAWSPSRNHRLEASFSAAAGKRGGGSKRGPDGLDFGV